MLRAYQAGDVGRVRVQKAQRAERAAALRGFEQIEAITQVSDSGEVLAVYGLDNLTTGEAECYALVGENAGPKLLEAVRFLQRILPQMMKQRHYQRLMMTVLYDFSAGRRLAQMLGFQAAEILPCFFMGKDYQIYERRME